MVAIFVSTATISSAGQNSGLLFHYEESEGRTWGAWVTSDINGDGKREIGICGAIYTKCLDLSGNVLWEQEKLHHEVQWGCDSGIDVNGDGITEQLVFEAVWNNHYLLDGKTGVALESDGVENRRQGLYWPNTDCGFGLNVNVNGQGHNDYVITGVCSWDTADPVVWCIESDNGSRIWEYTLSFVPGGIRPITINGTTQILVLSSKMEILSPQGTQVWYRMIDSSVLEIIPNGGGTNSDAILVGTGSGISLINASDNTVIWTAAIPITNVHYCGDINNDEIGDFGGLWPGDKKVGVFNGANGVLIRNHTAQNLLNYMHGVIYCGDLNNDGYDDYGIFGDFPLHEVFSGLDGSQLLAIGGKYFYGAEEMYVVEDVNGNGVPDIMLFNSGVTIIDGSTLGYVDIPFSYGEISGFNTIFVLIGIVGILIPISILRYNEGKINL